jgi:hypothetical protein
MAMRFLPYARRRILLLVATSLMNRNVRCEIFDESNTSLNATLTVRHGGRTTVALHRRT